MDRFMLLRIALAGLLWAPFAYADVTVGPVIGSNMVLQRETSVPIWGTAAPHEPVSVRFQQQHVDVLADDRGRWQAWLSPMAGSKVPGAMTIRGKNQTLVLDDVLVGEVWLVSGQSNMEFPMVGFPALGVHLPPPIQHRLQFDLAKADCADIRLFRMAVDGAKSQGHRCCESDIQ